MRLQEGFKNVFSYAAGMENWIKEAYNEIAGKNLTMTFPYDFAIADWYGEKSVWDTYKNVRKQWLRDYKAFTEVAITLSYLSSANSQLSIQGYEDREKFIDLYSSLYYTARDNFYDYYKDNEEAKDWFFEWTD